MTSNRPPGLVAVRSTLTAHRYVVQRTIVQDTARVEIVEDEAVTNVGSHHANRSHSSPDRPLNLLDDTFSECQIYCNQLLRLKHGFPLYVPGPSQNLPAEYRRSGVAIGDVGRITSEGIFDFFFNIYLPANDPINNNNVPDDYVPMEPYTAEDISSLWYDAGSHVSTSSVQRLDEDDFPGGEFVFGCHAPQGAVLALPHGAHLKKLENLGAMREYAAAHAESWYKHVNGRRGRQLANGLLYLVTGWEKAQTWGMASFHSVTNNLQLVFKPTARGNSPRQYRWSGNPAEKKCYDGLPINNAPMNQTTFIHGFSILLGTTVWGRLLRTVEIRDINNVELRSSGSKLSATPGFARVSSLLNFFGGGTSGGTQHGNIVLSGSDAIAEILHPGQLINEYIIHKIPEATVVLSHDNDWRDILGEDDPKSQILTVTSFLRRISAQYEVVEKNGTPITPTVLHFSSHIQAEKQKRP
ncbi:hypothetical protein C8R47DRAFT_1209458 [Mycena vitilis]|nr:hypothetical protein C8R47DRAFT_1209458 [Mycena vitilis]